MSNKKVKTFDYNAKIEDNQLIIEGSCTLAYTAEKRQAGDIQMVNYRITEQVPNAESLNKTLVSLFKKGAPGTRFGKAHNSTGGLTEDQYNEFLTDHMEHQGKTLYGSANKELDVYLFEGSLAKFDSNPFDTGSGKSLENCTLEELQEQVKLMQQRKQQQ